MYALILLIEQNFQYFKYNKFSAYFYFHDKNQYCLLSTQTLKMLSKLT